MTPEPYVYNAFLARVIDGDTVVLDIDLGMNITLNDATIRLYGLNAPELREQDGSGVAAREWMADQLKCAFAYPVTLQTIKDKDDKYGRLLGIIWIGDRNINDEMIAAGHAVRATYRATREDD